MRASLPENIKKDRAKAKYKKADREVSFFVDKSTFFGYNRGDNVGRILYEGYS